MKNDAAAIQARRSGLDRQLIRDRRASWEANERVNEHLGECQICCLPDTPCSIGLDLLIAEARATTNLRLTRSQIPLASPALADPVMPEGGGER